jgi:hypothetical protein
MRAISHYTSASRWLIPDEQVFDRRNQFQLLPALRVATPAIPPSVLRPPCIALKALEEIAADQVLSKAFRQRVAMIGALDSNWDGEGAKAARRESLLASIGLVRRAAATYPWFTEPSIAPTSDGFVILEWDSERRILEIETTARGWALVGTEVDSGGNRNYLTSECQSQQAGDVDWALLWFHLGGEIWQ